MLNLAPLRYRDVLAANGGPLEEVTCRETSLLGERWFTANAHLREDLSAGVGKKQVYGNASGSGSDRSPLVARFKAISEAMERWAHWAMFRSAEAARYGFDVDPSSTGLAAFPGLVARQARAAALMEAAERFNLLHWWEGWLVARPARSPWSGVDAAVIESEAPGVTVVLHRRAEHGHHAYGHAAAATFAEACRHAAIEMQRHESAVGRYVTVRRGEEPPADMHPIERRSLFFASDAGYAVFLEHLCGKPIGARAHPQPVFDGAVPGPWERYAHVWRVLFAPPSLRFLSRELPYFFW